MSTMTDVVQELFDAGFITIRGIDYVTKALATARREGAQEMRERCEKAAYKTIHGNKRRIRDGETDNVITFVCGVIRALPLEKEKS